MGAAPKLRRRRRINLRACRSRACPARRRCGHHDGRGGGAEKAWAYYSQGAPKVTEEVIAEGLEASKTWIKESIDLQLELKDKAGSRPPMAFQPRRDYASEVYERVQAVGSDRISKVTTISLKSEREAAMGEAAVSLIDELSPEFPGREKEISAAVRSLTKKLVRQRIVEEGVRIDGRGPPTSGPCRLASGSSLPLTVRGCSSGVKHRS